MPVVVAGISALASLAGGLLGAKAQAKQKQLDILQRGQEGQLAAQSKGADALQQGTSNVFGQLMQQYGGLVR